MAAHIDLFCEDSAHESFARAVTARVASETPLDITLRVRSAQFGISRVKRELTTFQELVQRRGGSPDLLIVMVDANAVGVQARRREIGQVVKSDVFPRYVVGTPDPHIERWYLSDPVSFGRLFDVEPGQPDAGSRSSWKAVLVQALESAGQRVVQGGAEFADEIVEALNFYRAGQLVPSFGAFHQDLRSALRQIALER